MGDRPKVVITRKLPGGSLSRIGGKGEAAGRRIRVCNPPDVLTEATADLGFGLLMAAARRFSESERFLREGKFSGWDPWGFLGVPVFGRTLGIVGMGKIGG